MTRNQLSKTFIQTISFIVVLLVFPGLSKSAFGQAVGDYGTRYTTGSYTWNTAANWIVCVTPGTWTGANIAAAIPNNTKNVWIRTGSSYTTNIATTCLNLDIASGSTLTVAGFNLTVSGTTSISGTISHSSTTGTKTFTGLVTINNNGIWNNSINEAITFSGGLTHNGSTFQSGTAVQTFNGTAKTISGSLSIASITISGTTTNNGTLTITTALAGASILTNGSSGILNIQGTCSITTLTNVGVINRSGTGTTTTALLNFTNTGTINISSSGTVTGITNNANGVVNHSGSSTITSFNNATSTSVLNISTTPTVPTFTTLTVTAAGNTVNYNGDGNQVIKAITYSNLILSGSGTKTIGTTANGTLTTGIFSIVPTGNAKARITNTNVAVNSLKLGNVGALAGTWGSTSSIAANTDNNYFEATSGYVNVAFTWPQYCIPQSTNGTSAGDFISLVQLGSINNSTGGLSTAPYYQYYNSLSTNLTQNTSYSISLKAGTYASGNNISVWIDYNLNGTFDAIEKLGNITLAGSATGFIDFTIPSSAVIGITRMRVREAYNNTIIDPCSTEAYGETEDYNVNIIEPISISTGSISPLSLCTGDSFNIPFTLIGIYNSGNIFTAQLSDASGSFSSPTNIGTLSQTTAGTIIGTLPTNTILGSGYRVRVISSNPAIIGTDNGSNLTIYASPDYTGTVTNASCNSSADGEIAINSTVHTPIEFIKDDGDYIDLGALPLSNLSQFTLEGWIKFNKADIIGTRVGSLFGQNDLMEFGIYDASSIQCYTTGGGTVSVPLTNYPNDNSWHHIAAIGNGSNITIYVDGTSIGSGGTSGVTNYGNSTTHTTKIGGGIWDPTGGSFSGQIKRTGFWSKALNASELATIASASYDYTGVETGLIAGYNFFEGAGTSLSQLPASTSGTFVNSPVWMDALTYAWTKTGDPAFNQTTKNISGLTTGQYNLTVSNGICSKSQSFTVSSLNLPTTISSQSTGAQTQCLNGTFSPITVSATGASLSYQWYYNTTPSNSGGITLGSGNGAQTNSYTPPATSAGTLYYYCIVSGSCGSVPSAVSGAFIVRPIPTSTVSGSASVCQNATNPTVTFNNPQSYPITLTYAINGINQPTINIGASTFATVNALTATAGSYIYSLVSVTYQTTPSCTNSISGSATITVTPTVGTPTAILVSAGSEPTCQLTNGTTTTTYATTATNNTGFNWSLSNGAAGSIGASTGIMTWANGFSGTVDIRVTANGCNGPSAQVVRTVTITPTVGTPTVISVSGGAQPTCQLTNGTTTTTYATTATNSTGFNWSISNGAAGSIGATTGIMTWANGFSGTVDIRVTANGCNEPSAQVVRTVTITPTVGTPTVISVSGGAQPTCQLTNGTTTTTYATTATNSTGFNWSISNGAAGSIGATTGIMTWANGFSGSVNIQVTANGCNGPSAQVVRSVTITPTVGTPTAITVSTGSQPTCQLTNGTTTTTYSSTATNNTGFNWSLSNPAAGSIGASTGIMTWANGFSGSVNIQVTANGCNGPSAQVVRTVTITPTVGTPVFTLGATSSRCKGAEIVLYSATATNTTGITYTLDAASALAGNTINASSGQVTFTASWKGTSIITANAAGCNGPAVATHTVTIIGDLTWTGAVNSNWNETGNWSCNFLPDLTTNVLIPNVANKPVLSSGLIGMAQNIIVNSSSSITVTGNILQISGTITNSGSFIATSGTIEMKGNVAQTINTNTFSGNTIRDLYINNINGVALLGPLNISGVVKAVNGDLSSGGNLTLLSTAAQTALIDGSGSGNINGNVTMQRYLPSGYGYKYFSSPFQAATVNSFSEELDLNATFPTFYKYDEDNHRDSAGISIYSTGWVKYITPSNQLVPMYGYAANFGDQTAAKTVSMSGVVNNNLSSTITLLNHNRIYTKGFSLVGNPYPSPIDWNAASGWTKTNIDDALYFFDASTTNQYTGTYSSYINGVPSNGLTSNIIPSMQGFFVHVSNGSFPVTATLGMNNQVRVNNLSPSFHKSSSVDSKPLIRLSARYESSKIFDPAVLYMSDFASYLFDTEFDALKLLNTDESVPNLYTLTSGSDKLSISSIPYPIDTLTIIPVGLKTTKDSWIIVKALNMDHIPAGIYLYFSDELTGTIYDLLQGHEYRIQLPKGTFESRFKILLSKKTINHLPDVSNTNFVTFKNGKLSIFVDPVLGLETNITISNLLGQVINRNTLTGSGSHEINSQLPSGIYVVALHSQSGKRTQKIYIPY